MSDTEFCPGGITSDVPHLTGPVPLPADAKTHALTLAQSLESNASLPTLVRAAARCVVQEVRFAMTRLGSMMASACLIGMVARASAQGYPDSAQLANDCHLVAQVVMTGLPAAKIEWAYAMVGNCGNEGIHALAVGIASMKSSVDTLLLLNLSRQASYYRDGGIFASALSVAGDPSASALARVYALLTLQHIIRPTSGNSYAEATSDFDSDGLPVCTHLTTSYSHQPVWPGITPLAADYREQAQAVTRRIWADASTPALVRAAASCPM